jgi:leucyl/phenylalanyl-tRNA--protein transferase
MPDPLAIESVLGAYASGFFVMDDGDTISYDSPDPRAIMPLVPAQVADWKGRRQIGFDRFEYRLDAAFEEVLTECAAPRDNGLEPFMTERVLDMYRDLYAAGLAHSVEAWEPGGDKPVAGLLGISLGRAFFAESTYHRVSGSGTATLVATLAYLLSNGFELCDIQFMKPHLARFGAVEVPRDEYLRLLRGALAPPSTE